MMARLLPLLILTSCVASGPRHFEIGMPIETVDRWIEEDRYNMWDGWRVAHRSSHTSPWGKYQTRVINDGGWRHHLMFEHGKLISYSRHR